MTRPAGRVEGPVLHVVFNRPEARNAMTFAMYEGLVEACERADASDEVRVVVLRGAGGRAFVAGTDIAQFAGFDGPRGVAYRRRSTPRSSGCWPSGSRSSRRSTAPASGAAWRSRPRPTSAWPTRPPFRLPDRADPGQHALGAQLRADAASLRARADHRHDHDRPPARRRAHTCGFVTRTTDDVDATTTEVLDAILFHAPLTMAAGKEILRRLHAAAGTVDVDDVVAGVYGWKICWRHETPVAATTVSSGSAVIAGKSRSSPTVIETS